MNLSLQTISNLTVLVMDGYMIGTFLSQSKRREVCFCLNLSYNNTPRGYVILHERLAMRHWFCKPFICIFSYY